MTRPHPGDTLHRLLHAYKRAMREAYHAADIRLPPSHVRVLKIIDHLPQCTAQAIAGHWSRDKAQITRIVQDLCVSGLVQRQTDPDDARRRILKLSVKGKAMQQHIALAEREAGARMVQGLPEEAVSEFLRLADVMTRNLDHVEPH